MYVLIDRAIMAITHKHSDREVLGKLSWIECTNSGVTISLSNTRSLSDFSAAELKALYKSATGVELKGYSTGMAQAVLEVARRMPDTVAKKDEVIAQAACIQDGDKSCYRYVFGQMRPEELPTLYQAPGITVERNEAEELRAAQVQTPTPAPATTTNFGPSSPAFTPANTSAAPVAQRGPSAPRTGGTRETIFKVADDMWMAAGSPNDLPRILALRKQIMTELEGGHNIKKTTSSTALGEWQKQRLT